MVVVQSDWLSLCLLTETNRPHEMFYVAWAIRNRVDRQDRFPNHYFGVVTQPMQFSWFNDKGPLADTSECFYGLKDLVEKQTTRFLEDQAEKVAVAVMSAEPWMAPFDAKVDHYYSPISMKPRGRVPVWARDGVCHNKFTPPGVDPDRFVFVQERP